MDHEKGRALQERFNEAISEMKKDHTLETLLSTYLSGSYDSEPEAVAFESFADAETVSIALTGDIPPVDYIDASGQPAGFNTAVLAEIGRRLKINIDLRFVNTGSRSLELMSGRSDAVFWYQIIDGGNGISYDTLEGMVFSDPYYTWDLFLHVRKK